MIRIGISGWRYAPWRGVFYPRGLRQDDELAFASRALDSIEINGSFYSLQRPALYRHWHDQTPDDFVFAVKAPRYITHVRRLKDIETPMANFLASGVLALNAKLGPMLWQFPPNFHFKPDLFEPFLAMLPHDTEAALDLARGHAPFMRERSWLDIDRRRPLRHAVEIRHESFLDEAFVRLLRRYRVALVVADTAGKWPYKEDVSADFVYLRLHGDKEIYASGYGAAALERWAGRIRAWSNGAQPDDAHLISQRPPPARKHRHVFCYFDNDIKVRAPFDAANLARLLGVPHALDAQGRFEVALPAPAPARSEPARRRAALAKSDLKQRGGAAHAR
ncbi:DUF72 domain-containing protein [Methylibium rhizosphaerae]|uniref:DUF72 domain-containing protein n=1 Tax=Methylibium rhizosphaerae TaxID=2570323 RepID=UPI0011276E87|nr:DUF72 domain-containing protein [Methylibium rhizosphaerae]